MRKATLNRPLITAAIDFVMKKLPVIRTWDWQNDTVYFRVLLQTFTYEGKPPAGGRYEVLSVGVAIHDDDLLRTGAYVKPYPAVEARDGRAYRMVALDETRPSYMGDSIIRVNNREKFDLAGITEELYTGMFDRMEKLAKKIVGAVAEFRRLGMGAEGHQDTQLKAYADVAQLFFNKWTKGTPVSKFRHVYIITRVENGNGVGVYLNQPIWKKYVNTPTPQPIPADLMFKVLAISQNGDVTPQRNGLAYLQLFLKDPKISEVLKEVEEVNQTLGLWQDTLRVDKLARRVAARYAKAKWLKRITNDTPGNPDLD